jgi:thiamine-monophosphate kinase
VLDFKDKKVVISTDILVEGVHFDFYMPLKHLGYKAVTTTFLIMKSYNKFLIAVSNRFPLEALDELFAGITHAATEYKVDVIGGDTSSQRVNHQHHRNWRRMKTKSFIEMAPNKLTY